jgi:hypothetical protein
MALVRISNGRIEMFPGGPVGVIDESATTDWASESSLPPNAPEPASSAAALKSTPADRLKHLQRSIADTRVSKAQNRTAKSGFVPDIHQPVLAPANDIT